MAFGQIDPARLDGDALTRWYLRSPADIEQEQRAAAAQKYDSFFGVLGDGGQAGDDSHPHTDNAATTGTGGLRNAADSNRWQLDASTADQGFSPDTGLLGPSDPSQLNPANSGHYQLAAATMPGFWDHWSVTGCANCHGYTPGTLPPVGGHFPLPSGYSPRSGGSGSSGRPPPSSGGRASAGSNPPQCAIQYDNDSAICRRVPDNDVRRACWESAAEREGYCIRSKGQVGSPSLITR